MRDGTWVTVEDRKANYFYAFNGVINDKTGAANFVPFELTRVPEGTLVREITDPANREAALPDAADPKRDILLGRTVTFDDAGGIKLRVTGKGEWAFATPFISDASQYSDEMLEQDFGISGIADCCVTCQTRTICATAVSTSCGGCGGGGGGALEY